MSRQHASQCEKVPPNSWRRHWKLERPRSVWHLIADGPDLMSRLPKAAHFLTILSYLPGPDDQPPHYQGPLYAEADGDLSDVLRDMRRCVEVLTIEYDLPAEAVRLWLSGGRSVHLTIPASVIGADEGHPLLPDLYKVMVETLFPPTIAPTLDRGIYNRGKGRMWRLPNRRRTDTQRYKVPISASELLHKSLAELKALTCQPRKGVFWPADVETLTLPWAGPGVSGGPWEGRSRGQPGHRAEAYGGHHGFLRRRQRRDLSCVPGQGLDRQGTVAREMERHLSVGIGAYER